MMQIAIAAMCPKAGCGYIWKNENPVPRQTEQQANADAPRHCPHCKSKLEVYGVEVGKIEEFDALNNSRH